MLFFLCLILFTAGVGTGMAIMFWAADDGRKVPALRSGLAEAIVEYRPLIMWTPYLLLGLAAWIAWGQS